MASPLAHIDGAITIRQLLNLTSGIDDFVGDPNSPFRVGYVNIDFEKMWTWEEIQALFIGNRASNPGTKCEYSSDQLYRAETCHREGDAIEAIGAAR